MGGLFQSRANNINITAKTTITINDNNINKIVIINKIVNITNGNGFTNTLSSMNPPSLNDLHQYGALLLFGHLFGKFLGQLESIIQSMIKLFSVS